MNNSIFTMFLKDLRETLRDRRNLVRMLLLPGVLIPLMGHFFIEFAANQRESLEKKVLPFAVAGGQYLPDLVKAYDSDPGFKRVDVPANELQEAVRSKKVRFALEIPRNANEVLKKGGDIDIKFYYYQSAPSEILVKERGTAPLQSYGERQRDWRLVFLGVANESDRTRLLHPVEVDVVNTASDRERIGHDLGSIIAYPLLLICFMGCTFTAVDLVAGEKERGTLEILVMLPVPRYQIVLGKYLVIFALGLVYATLSLVSLSTWLSLEAMKASAAVKGVLVGIRGLDVFLLWAMLVPVVAFFSAIVLAISIYAKSNRQANTLMGFANMIVVMSAMITFVPGMSLTWLWSLVPVANIGMVMRELIKGTLSNYLMILSIFSTTFVLGMGVLLLCTAWFRREAVIYRE